MLKQGIRKEFGDLLHILEKGDYIYVVKNLLYAFLLSHSHS